MRNILFILLLEMLLFAAPSVSFAHQSLHQATMINLSNNAIICMHQDKDGFLWIGTYDGLNLYNGKDTYVFRFELNNENSLCSNIIHKISDAEPGYLWIATSLGINKFSLIERHVVESYPGYMECELMATDSSGITLAVCKDNRISCYSPHSDGFRDLPKEGISPQNVKTLFHGKDGHFYLLLSSGILKQLTPNFTDKNFDLLSEEHIFHDKPILIASNENDNIFFVDNTGKLYCQKINSQEKTFISDISTSIQQYGSINKIGTFKNDIFIAFRNGTILNINHPEKSINIGIGLFCLMKDLKQEIFWIGTDGQGIRMLFDKPDLFGSILLNELPINIQNPIRSLFTDEEGALWFGTKGDGIVRINNYDTYQGHKTIPLNSISHFTKANGLADNRVYCFHKSTYHPLIWIGSDGPGLSYYSLKNRQIRTIQAPDKVWPIQHIHSICESDDSTLWIATTRDGLLKLNVKSNNSSISITSIKNFKLKKGDKICREIQAMVYDNDSTLYLGSRGGYGVIRFNIFSYKYEFMQPGDLKNLAIGDVLSVCPAKDSTFYIGSSSGLTKLKYIAGKASINQFNQNNGIANEMIHGIFEGNDSCIWLSTNKGITQYNPINNFFHNYHRPYLNVTEFSDDAYWKCPYSGRLFFGGINGLVWINKQTETKHYYQPELKFFAIQMDNQTYPLNDAICQKGINIPAHVQNVNISFVAPDYINGENYEYAYQLVNYNNSWKEIQKENKATFMNLPHGKYLLKVRYRNDVTNSITKEYTLPIKVLPPFYLSPFALGFYLFSCLIFIAFCIYRILKKQRQIAEKIKKEQKEKLYEAKLNFFTHITHELCTPLTLINGVNAYIQKYSFNTNDKEIAKYTTVLQENVNELNELIQEILDFRKAEDAGFEHANIQNVSVSSILHSQCDCFYSLAKERNIRFLVEAPQELHWNTDPIYFKKILINLVSNAFKYTHNKGIIRISLNVIKQHLVLKVYNTGKGIKEEEKQQIFDRYRILNSMDIEDSQHTTRNGLGLFICHSLIRSLNGEIQINSQWGKYAEFQVSLPFKEETKESIKDEKSIPTYTCQDCQELTKTTKHPIQENKNNKSIILVIDDHKDIVWLISETLSPYYQVKGAHEAEEGLTILKQCTPALIITDIMMPKMNGLELISLIKDNKYTRHIPIIIVSAKISNQEQAEGLNIGADAYLTKPFSPTVLLSTVNRLITTQRELKDYFYSPESAYQYTDGQLLHHEDKEFIDAVITIIKENIGKEGLGPELIAEMLHINTRTLYRRFKKISSMTPSDFIKDYKLTHAAQLLVTTNMSVQEIIYEVGISNKSYFYREFSRKYGMTPKEYRNQKA